MKLLRRLGVTITLWTFGLMMIGGYVKAIHAGLACPDWPLCYGQWFPPFSDPTGVHNTHQIMAEWIHRFAATFLGPFILAFAYLAWKEKELHPVARWTPTVAIGVLAIQVYMGGLTVLNALQPLIVVSHLGLATVFFGMMLTATVLIFAHTGRGVKGSVVEGGGREADGVWRDATPEKTATETTAPPQKASVKDYLSMMKLRVSFLLTLSAVTAMFLAQGGTPPLVPTLAVIAGGTLMVGGSGAINHFYERETDKLMERTRDRPVASGRVPAHHALLFGLFQGVAAFVVLEHFANLLSAAFALAGLLFYVFVYTIWLKHSTPMNIVYGGAAGSFPVLVGWSAVAGTITLPALLFALLIFVWTPPHFWALALVLKDDYTKAGIPMMPSVKGDAHTTMEILVYSVIMVAVSLAFYPLGTLGRIYLIAAALLGGLFLALAIDLKRSVTKRTARKMFGYSILYLGLLYVAMVADLAIAWA